MCPNKIFTDSKGAIVSTNYPTFTSNLNCEANINTAPNTLIKLYIKDLSLDSKYVN